MIGRHLAELYGVEARMLNQAVKRNLQRFPADFMFQMTEEEFDNLIFQIGRSSWGGHHSLLRPITEQGVMLSWLLHLA
ncbi:MAG: hypothetical protein DRJ13_07140 [Bacteroidetes bacterium]|nr:MAG: hypothetical protein DRJ13_07140 [Bacteroidota bacterium]